MELRRMPFPAARHAVSDVGTSRDQRPGTFPRLDPQVGRLLWRGQPRIRQIRSRPVRQVRRCHLWGVPQETVAAQDARQTHGDRARQRALPSRGAVGASAASISKGSYFVFPSALQPTARASRACLEADAPPGNPQSVLRHLGRSTHGGRRVLRAMAKT